MVGESPIQLKLCSPEEAEINYENIEDIYEIGDVIGKGKFGSVRVASPYSNPSLKFAIKSVPKSYVDHSKTRKKQFEKEVRILRMVDNPNIIRFYEVYQDDENYHIVLEHCEGGELYDKVGQEGRLEEDQASKMIKQLLSALSYLHRVGICHRDLKPENILLKPQESKASIKLIDFSHSTFAQDGRVMKNRVGTPMYMAPEILKGKYKKSWDMWSLGAISYVMLSGSPPFIADSNEKSLMRIMKADYNFSSQWWEEISDEAKDFISRLLVKDPAERMSAEEALEHPWLK